MIRTTRSGAQVTFTESLKEKDFSRLRIMFGVRKSSLKGYWIINLICPFNIGLTI